MKKLFLLISAMFLAFCMSETVVTELIGYPRYVNGVRSYNIHTQLGPYNRIRVLPAKYSKWSVEGGNQVVQCNNIGFNGPDVTQRAENKSIILLGNSYIEAGQYPGDQISAAFLQKEMLKVDSLYQVVNLGASAHDPYVLWHRLLFFEPQYKPEKVVLIYESFSTLRHYYSRWANSSPKYEEKLEINEIRTSQKTKIQRKIRTVSGYLNLMVSAIKKDSNNSDPVSDSANAPLNEAPFSDEDALVYLKASLEHFSAKYRDSFFFVSLMRDNPYHQELSDFCSENNIKYFYNQEINIPQNKINGSGHFNQRGNEVLGQYLASILQGQQ